MGDPSPDLPSSSEDHSSPESSPSPLPPSESPVSENMTATLSPEQFSRPGLASSEEMSATPETAPFSASPTVQPSPMEILEFQVARAKAKEDELCTVLDEAYKQETDLFQEAQDARQKAKDQDLKAKKIRAEVIALKARAQEFEKKVKALKSLRPDREKEVEEAQHERADVEKKLEDMKYEEMLVERYSDVVIRKLIKRTEKDYELNEIFEGFMVGDARLQDAEALEVELDNICEEISREKAETLSAGSGTPNGEEVKEEDADGKTAGKSGRHLHNLKVDVLTRI
jgi:chromosome segregation ATPase